MKADLRSRDLNSLYSKGGLRAVYHAGLIDMGKSAVIEPKPGELVVDFAGQLRGRLAGVLNAEAKRRRLEPADLAVRILETVITDNLFSAVLDD